MTQTEALRLALEALESYSKSAYIRHEHPKRWANGNKAITAIKEALAQPDEKEAALLRALEIIAVGDANNPQAQAAEELIALGYWRDIPEAIALAQPEQEPFGYFKHEPFGWTDCAETDEGAIALYDRPQRKK